MLGFAVAAFVLLVVGSLIRWSSVRHGPADVAHRRLGSLWSWWIVAAAVLAAAFLDRIGVAVLMMTVSWLSFREFVKLVDIPRGDPYVTLVNWIWLPLHYLLAMRSGNPILVVFLPVMLLLCGGCLLVFFRQTAGFVWLRPRYWGSVLTVTTLVHVVMLLARDKFTEPVIGRIGFALYLIFVTEGNDIAQALVGRSWGATRSPPSCRLTRPGKGCSAVWR